MNNAHVEKRLKEVLESLPRLFKSGIITGGTHGRDYFSLTAHKGDYSVVFIQEREGTRSRGIYFYMGEAVTQVELERPFMNECDHMGDYFCDLANPRSEEIQLFLTVYPGYSDFIIGVCDYITELANRSPLFNFKT